MAKDHSLAVRRAIVTALKADEGVSALVGDRVHAEQPTEGTAWPFIRYGLSAVTPYEASCWDGSEHDVTLHAFANGPGTDNVLKLAEAVRSALEDTGLPLPGGIELIVCTWTSTDVLRDTDETGAYHAVLRFTVQTANRTD